MGQASFIEFARAIPNWVVPRYGTSSEFAERTALAVTRNVAGGNVGDLFVRGQRTTGTFLARGRSVLIRTLPERLDTVRPLGEAGQSGHEQFDRAGLVDLFADDGDCLSENSQTEGQMNRPSPGKSSRHEASEYRFGISASGISFIVESTSATTS